MEIPDWADERLSKDLPVLRARGENQDLEYKESFPRNVRRLAKEIAAFATSNTGTVLVGVSDKGDLVGLEEAKTADGRDQLLQRVEGLCRGTVKPAITPTAKFAIEAGKAVLVLIVPKGSQPVYYCHNVPYIRHITESRPAEPHEVIMLVRSDWAARAPQGVEEELDAESQLLSELGRIINDILIYADEVSERNVNPWLEMWRTEFTYSASELRELAAEDIAVEKNIAGDLNELADALDEVAKLRLFMGSGPELDRLTKEAATLARELKQDLIDPIPLSEGSLDDLRALIVASSRKLSNLVSRADELMDSGHVEELQSEASDIGLNLLRASYYNIEPPGEGVRD
jgi:hypothetical protein